MGLSPGNKRPAPDRGVPGDSSGSSTSSGAAPASQRRRTVPDSPPPNPPPLPGCTWQEWAPPLASAAGVDQFTLEGRRYCYRRSKGSRSRVRAVLSDGSIGPAVGWRSKDGGLSLEPGEWVGELLDASVLSPPSTAELGQQSPASSLPAKVDAFKSSGVAAVRRGEPWILPPGAAVDIATVAAARLEAEKLLCAPGRGVLRSSNHGQQSAVRDDKVAFFPLGRHCDGTGSLKGESEFEGEGEGGEEGPCPPALARCFQTLIELASLDGIAQAVTGGGAPLLLPPVGMLAVYDGNRSKYVAHVDNDLVASEAGTWQWRNARVLTAIMYVRIIHRHPAAVDVVVVVMVYLCRLALRISLTFNGFDWHVGHACRYLNIPRPAACVDEEEENDSCTVATRSSDEPPVVTSQSDPARQNPLDAEWSEKDGGAFRYWPSFHAGAVESHPADAAESSAAAAGDSEPAAAEDDNAVDVLPVGGTVVLFDSRRLRHAVCPANRRRVALSAWFVSPATVIEEEEEPTSKCG